MSDIKKSVSAVMPTIKEVKFTGVSGKEISFEVKKLPIGKVVELLDAIQEIPKELANIDRMDESEILQNISMIIAVAIPKFVDIVVNAIEDESVTSKVILDEFGLDNTIEVIYTILVVNNALGIMDTLKKVKALIQPKAEVVVPHQIG